MNPCNTVNNLGVYLSWICPFEDTTSQTEQFGLWVINVHNILLHYYKLFTEQYDYPGSSSVYQFFEDNPELMIRLENLQPISTGVPLFLTWQPLPPHDPVTIAQAITQFKKSDSYTMDHPFHQIFAHSSLKHLYKLDLYTPMSTRLAATQPFQVVANYIPFPKQRYGMFDCPLMLPNGWFVYVVTREKRYGVDFSQTLDENYLIFEDVEKKEVVKEICIGSNSLAITSSSRGTCCCFALVSPQGLCTGITIINLQNHKSYKLQDTVAKLFFFCNEQEKSPADTYLVYLACGPSISQWCAWNERLGTIKLESIYPCLYTDRAYYQFFCQYNLSMLWASPDGKYMCCPGYHGDSAQQEQQDPALSSIFVQEIKSGSRSTLVSKGVYAVFSPM